MDIWIIGDTFLQDTFATLQTLRSSASLENKNPLYIYEQYNVFIFFMPKSNQQIHTLGHIHHSIVEAFNRRYHLPWYILMILDKDIIEAVNFYDYGGITHTQQISQLDLERTTTLCGC